MPAPDPAPVAAYVPPVRRKSLIEKAIDESELFGVGDVDAILGTGPAAGAPPPVAVVPREAVPEVVQDPDGGRERTSAREVMARAAADTTPPEHGFDDPDGPTPLPAPWVIEETDESGPRVVASLGADSASAVGEVSSAAGSGPHGAPQRELVTIQPRRQTREVPIVTVQSDDAEPVAAAASAPEAPVASPPSAGTSAPTVAKPVAVGRSKSSVGKSAAAKSGPVAAPRETNGARRPRTLPPPPRPVSASPTPPPREGGGPRWGAMAIGAVALAALAFIIVRASGGDGDPAQPRAGTGVVAAAADAGAAPALAVDAAVVALAPEVDAAVVALAPEVDAGRAATIDAAVAVTAAIDAGALASDAAAAPDYKDKLAAAKVALEDGDYQRAVAYADESLAMRRSARAYVLKADALRRLGKTALALGAAEAAIGMLPTYAPGWEMLGRILWSERRYDEARPAMRRYLELQPRGETADTFRALLEPTKPRSPEAPSPTP